jgi:hypothetical protein
MSSLTSVALLRALETVLFDMPSLAAMSLMVAIKLPPKICES